MPRCAECGSEHEVLDPAFKRPEPYVQLAEDERERHARASDDLCVLRLPGDAERCFLRTVLPVEVAGHPDGIWWGVWVELAPDDYERVRELWEDEDQSSQPPIPGALANRIPSYPEPPGLPVLVQLTGPTSRPESAFSAELDHPFAAECRSGVSVHRASEWMALMQPH